MIRFALLALLCCSFAAARAQTVQPLAGFLTATGIAVDGNGNVFVVDNRAGLVNELPAGKPGTPVPLGTGIGTPVALAVDRAGDVFVTDSSTIYEVPAGYGSLRKLVGGFQYAAGLAVDGSGNLFVSDLLANTVSIIQAVDGAIPASPQIVTIGSGFARPQGLALDPQDNVYLVDNGNGAVKRILAAGGYATVQSLASGLTNPQVLAVDAAGDVFVGDSTDNSVSEIVAASGYGTVQSLVGNLGGAHLDALAVDAAGDLFIGVDNADISANGNGSVLERPAGGGALQPVHSFAVPTGIAIDPAGDLFVSDGYAASVTELTAASRFSGAVPVTAGLSAPSGLALDAAGDLFVTDQTGSVKELLAASGFTQIHAYGSGFAQSHGIALDGAGNIYVANTFQDAVQEMTAADGYATIHTLAAGFAEPYGVAVDSRGNVYVADSGNGAVKEILAVDGSIPSTPVIQTLGSGFVTPIGIAVDAAGNLYVADSAPTVQALRELLAAGNYSQSITLPGDGLDPYAVAVDGKGDLFVTEFVYFPPQPHQPPSSASAYEILAGPPILVASILPGSRSVEDGTTATVFATMINGGSTDFTACGIGLAGNAPSVNEAGGRLLLHYQPTDPATNLPIGAPDTPVPLAGQGGSQSFILSFTGQDFAVTGLPLAFSCSQNDLTGPTSYAAVVPGVDTVDLSMSATAVPDIIALSATPTGNGVVEIPSGASAAFAVASLNLGSTAPITVTVDSGGATLPVTATICETDPATSQCLAPPAASVALDFAANAAPTFSIFAQASGTVPFAPATSRLFVRFKDATGGTHGSTSVAIDTK